MKKYDENKLLDIDKEKFAGIEEKINLHKKKSEEEIKELIKTAIQTS